MTQQLYVNEPGGIVVHTKDGAGKTLAYGAPVDVDDLSEATARYIDRHTDTTFRGVDSDPNLEAAAHARAALADNGQVHQGSSPVPANYSELDEDTKVRLVSNLARYPESQAQLLIHERLFGGDSQKVQDAATDYARISAEMQIAQSASAQIAKEGGPRLEAGFTGFGDVEANPGDPGRTATVVARANAAADLLTPPEPTAYDPATRGSDTPDGGEASDYSAFSYDQLKGYVDQHNLDVAKNQSKENLVQDIAAQPGHDKPQTPPAS